MKISQIGMNVAGDDKYQIRMDSGEQIYLPVNKFMIDASNFKGKTFPHGRPVPEELIKKGKHRKDDVEAQKAWRDLHWSSYQDIKQGVYTNESAIAREIRADKAAKAAVKAREQQAREEKAEKKKAEKKKAKPVSPKKKEPKVSAFVTCPAIKHSRSLVTVDDVLVELSEGADWDIFNSQKWAALQYNLEINVTETVINLVEFLTYPDPCAKVNDVANPFMFLTDKPVTKITWMDLQHNGQYTWPSARGTS